MKNLLKKISNIFRLQKETYLIESNEDMEFVIQNLEDELLVGLDTEFDWRNTYFPKLSLLQISTQSLILLIDCLKCKDLNFLKKILEDSKVLVIFHSARSDTTVLNTNLDIKIKNAYDIQIAEKNLCKDDIKNYGSIVKKYFRTDLDKSETNSNWLKRPFSQNQLIYAANDVAFLIGIYKKQLKKLKQYNLVDKVIRESNVEATFGNQDLYVSRLKKLKKASKLEKEIFVWRENYASKKNVPPSHIFKDRFLKIIANEMKNKKFDETSFFNLFKNNNFAKDFLKFMNT